jgi:hypothetical protein
MSHFTTIRTQLTDKDALAQGIENLLKEKGITALTEWVYGEETVSKDGTITLEITKKPDLMAAWF